MASNLTEYWQSLTAEQQRLIATVEIESLTVEELEHRSELLRAARKIIDSGSAPEPLRRALKLFRPGMCTFEGCTNEAENYLVRNELDPVDEEYEVCYPLCKTCYEKVRWLW